MGDRGRNRDGCEGKRSSGHSGSVEVNGWEEWGKNEAGGWEEEGRRVEKECRGGAQESWWGRKEVGIERNVRADDWGGQG